MQSGYYRKSPNDRLLCRAYRYRNRKSDYQSITKELGTDRIRFYPGVSYRHLVVISDFPQDLKSTPPHDITDCEITPHLPSGDGADIITSLMEKAHSIISNFKNNQRSSKTRATDIWLWGQGNFLKLPTLQELFSLNGSVISAVDLVKGLGVLAGLEVPSIEGATGYLGTNYAGKTEAAFKALETQDLVYLHVEAPDETSHEGALQKRSRPSKNLILMWLVKC